MDGAPVDGTSEDGLIRLAQGDLKAAVDPSGGRLQSLSRDNREFLAGARTAEAHDAYRGALLAPWPNRLADGRWEWAGRTLELPISDPRSHSAMHGLVARAAFNVVEQTGTGVLLEHVLDPSTGYPFPLLFRVSYALEEDGVACRLEAHNIGDSPAPVGLGVHPYVAASGLVDELTLTLPAATVPTLDAQWLELGRASVEAAGLDFRAGRQIGALVLDTAFTDLEHDPTGRVEVHVDFTDGSRLTMWAGPTCRWLTVYSADTLPPADRRRSLAVEPQTCGANALRTGNDLDVVAPGELAHLDWGYLVPRGTAR